MELPARDGDGTTYTCADWNDTPSGTNSWLWVLSAHTQLTAWLLAYAAIGVIVSALFHSILAVVAVIIVALGLSQFLGVKRRAAAHWLIDRLQYEENGTLQMFCWLSLSFKGAEYGNDYGILQLSSGFLHFHGIRTDFAFSSSCVDFTDDWHRMRLDYDPRFIADFKPLKCVHLPQESEGLKRLREIQPGILFSDEFQAAMKKRSYAEPYAAIMGQIADEIQQFKSGHIGDIQVVRLPPLVAHPSAKRGFSVSALTTTIAGTVTFAVGLCVFWPTIKETPGGIALPFILIAGAQLTASIFSRYRELQSFQELQREFSPNSPEHPNA